MPLLGSGNLALRRDRFWEIGGFDEIFPVAGAEDQDFSIRARAAGALLVLDTNIHSLHNDNRLTLRDYCLREERSAETMPYLVRKYPSELGQVPYVRENRPIQAGDPPSLVLKKAVKTVLAGLALLEFCTGSWPRSRPLMAPSVCSSACTRCCWEFTCSAGSDGHGGRRAQITIVIVLHNSAGELVDCLDRSGRDRGRVGRADRGGQRVAGPECRDRAARAARARLLTLEENRGFAAGPTWPCPKRAGATGSSSTLTSSLL